MDENLADLPEVPDTFDCTLAQPHPAHWDPTDSGLFCYGRA